MVLRILVWCDPRLESRAFGVDNFILSALLSIRVMMYMGVMVLVGSVKGRIVTSDYVVLGRWIVGVLDVGLKIYHRWSRPSLRG